MREIDQPAMSSHCQLAILSDPRVAWSYPYYDPEQLELYMECAVQRMTRPRNIAEDDQFSTEDSVAILAHIIMLILREKCEPLF